MSGTDLQGDEAAIAAPWPAPAEAAFEHAALGIALVAPDGRVLRANATLCDMLGYTGAELARFGMGAVVHDEDIVAERTSREMLAASAEPTDQRELRLR